MNWAESSLLITGGTGSLGRHLVRLALERWRPRRIIVLSRDEVKQQEMRLDLDDDPSLRFFLGDVRDRDRLYRAFSGVDYVVHAAALKQVPSAEYNPLEVIRTNVLGAANVIDAAIDCGVKRVIALSTDKAVAPVNLYGATKMCADKLFVAARFYAGTGDTQFAVVRYGNVIGSRGSVIPLFLRERAKGEVPITDPRMTRFWLTLDQAVAFVGQSLERMSGGEIFVPKLPSMRIVDLAEAIAPGCTHRIVGIRPGEKLHEVLLTEDEARYTTEYDEYLTIRPGWEDPPPGPGSPVPADFRYATDTNSRWLSVEEIREQVGVAPQGPTRRTSAKPPAPRADLPGPRESLTR